MYRHQITLFINPWTDPTIRPSKKTFMNNKAESPAQAVAPLCGAGIEDEENDGDLPKLAPSFLNIQGIEHAIYNHNASHPILLYGITSNMHNTSSNSAYRNASSRSRTETHKLLNNEKNIIHINHLCRTDYHKLQQKRKHYFQY